MMADMLVGVNWLVLAYVVAVNSAYLGLMLLAFMELRQEVRTSRHWEDKLIFRHSASLMPVTIVAPAYNEALTVVESVRALLGLNYPAYEVILVNDGSTDDTLPLLVESFGLVPMERASTYDLPTAPIRGIYRSTRVTHLTVIDKENGGKADALNAGLNHSRHPLYIAIDTDTLLAKDALLKMLRPFMEAPETLAVGGLIRVVNGCRVRDGEIVRFGLPANPLARMQVVEYFRAFLFGRAGWGRLNMLLIISGAFGMFRTAEVVASGGYWTNTVGEDVEIVVRLHRRMREQRRRYRIRFLSDPVCWTEVPESVRVLGRQRNRWARGLLETAARHARMLFNPRYGRIGLVALPFNLVVEGLGGLFELGGLGLVAASWYAGLVDPSFAAAFFGAAFVLGVVVSMSAVLLDELIQPRMPSVPDLLRVLAVAVAEGAFYRPLNSFWRIQGLVTFLRGDRSWGRMTRVGYGGGRGAAGP